MQWIKHRVNTLDELAVVQPAWGLELDVRAVATTPDLVRVAHDPWAEGVSFAVWLEYAVRRGIGGPLIINTKDDGLEGQCLKLLEFHGISDFFFLDTQLPTLVRWAIGSGERRFAVRCSVYEPIEAVELWAGKVDWVWVDCFAGVPMPVDQVARLRRSFRVCLVSPELQVGRGLDLPSRIASFRALLPHADAVCTKVPTLWEG